MLHIECGTFYGPAEAHRCPEPCECCGLLIAVAVDLAGRPYWAERFVGDGAFAHLSVVVHTPNRCAAWRSGRTLPQGLGGREIPAELL